MCHLLTRYQSTIFPNHKSCVRKKGVPGKETTFSFAITVDDKAIGSIAAFRQSNIHSKTAEVGYYIAEPYWGKGLGTSAIRQICEYIFRNTDIIRLFAEPFAHNIGSCRILEKSGFQLEGTLRKNAVKNGVVVDMKMYSILNCDKA